MAHRPVRPHNFRALSKPKHIHKNEHRHYWPYIPLILLVLGTFLLSLAQPIQRHGVLAYATSMSTDSLLQATNQQRKKNGSKDLSFNSQLASAAQAKASDMITRNYWSHSTPDGQQPWVFIDKAGYKYLKAGENLAYGFADGEATISGWMNSPSHRENLLDNAYTEVGFGYANGENFNNSGPETVVVAMYGKPQGLAATSPSTLSQAPSHTTTNTTTTVPAHTSSAGNPATAAVNTENLTSKEPPSQQIARVQTVTNGRASWALFAAGLLSGLSMMFLLFKHAAGIRHLIRDSERLILHHPLLDSLLVSLVLIGTFMSQTSGFIR